MLGLPAVAGYVCVRCMEAPTIITLARAHTHTQDARHNAAAITKCAAGAHVTPLCLHTQPTPPIACVPCRCGHSNTRASLHTQATPPFVCAPCRCGHPADLLLAAPPPTANPITVGVEQVIRAKQFPTFERQKRRRVFGWRWLLEWLQRFVRWLHGRRLAPHAKQR